MAARYLLDTDTCIYIVRRKPADVQQRLSRLKVGDIAISVITFGELQYGAMKSQSQLAALANLQEFVSYIPVLDLDDHCARTYGEMRAALERQGQPIGNNDLWIAAHARSAGLKLVTNNEREFRRVPGLAVENWISAKN